jgi:hypothetical protein
LRTLLLLRKTFLNTHHGTTPWRVRATATSWVLREQPSDALEANTHLRVRRTHSPRSFAIVYPRDSCRRETPHSAWLQRLMCNFPMLQATTVEKLFRPSPRSALLLVDDNRLLQKLAALSSLRFPPHRWARGLHRPGKKPTEDPEQLVTCHDREIHQRAPPTLSFVDAHRLTDISAPSEMRCQPHPRNRLCQET